MTAAHLWWFRLPMWQRAWGRSVLPAVLLLFSACLTGFGQTTISTLSSWDGSSAAYSFGFPNGVAVDTYGQTFTVPSGVSYINDINFRVGYNFGDGVSFTGYLMGWDGTEATGPVLFESAPASVDSSTVGLAEIDFPMANVAVISGNTYVFFLLATPGTGGAATAQFGVTGDSSAYSGGSFVFTDSGGSFANLSSPWMESEAANLYGDAAFAATFNAPGPASYFSLIAPSSTNAGSQISITVTALDGNGNTATGYSGTVQFSSSDPLAILPANSALSNGTGTFSATLNTPGVQNITATDTITPSITGTTGWISVTFTPVLGSVAGTGTPLAINANNSGLSYNAVLNIDSSVSLVQNGALLSGVSCPAYAGLTGGTLSAGAVYLDGTHNTIYLAMTSGPVLYAAYETIGSQGACTQGPLLTITSEALSNLAINVDVTQGNIYVLNSFGAYFDLLYILPTAPWSASQLPTPAQHTMDYSVEYGPIVIDASTHQVFINDLGESAEGAVPGTFSTSGFFVFDPNYTGSAPNPEHVAGYITPSGGTATPFNVGTLLDSGNGILVLVNENPNASSAPYSAGTPPITIFNTTAPGFSFFANTQQAQGSEVDITTASALPTIAPATQYYAVGAADINTAASLVYAFVFNQSTFSGPEELIAYNYAALQETVLNSSVAMPSQVPDLWQQLNYDSESTGIVLSASTYNSGDLGVTTPLCAGSPSLNILLGDGTSSTPLDLPVVNQNSGYVYAIQPAVTYPPPGTPAALKFVAPAGGSCSSSQPTPAAIAATAGGGQSAVIGQMFANPLVVKVTDANNDPVAGATVTFTAPVSGASASLSSTAVTTGSDGTASVTATANGIASTSAYSISASVAGVSTPAVFALTNAQAPTSLVVTPAPLALQYGQSVTITATISPSSVLSTTPTGTVTFYDGTAALSPNAQVSAGVATYTVNEPAVGSHVYFAQYLGDTNFQASALTASASTVSVSAGPINISDPETVTVNDSDTQVQVITTSDPELVTVSDIPVVTVMAATQLQLSGPPQTTYGDSYFLAAAVTTAGGSQVASGTVTFSESGSALATVAVNGQGVADFITATLPAGTDVISAIYNGAAQFLPSSAQDYSVAVAKAGSATTLTESSGGASAGHNTTFTAAVTSSTSGTPTGTVTFYDGSVAMGQETLVNGVASLTTDSLPDGSDTITADYGGDANFLSSTSTAVTPMVSDFTMTMSASSTSGTLQPGESGTFTFTVTPTDGAYDYPVTFSVSGLPPGGSANFSSTSVTPGNNPVTATLTITDPAQASNADRGLHLRDAAPACLALLLPIGVLCRRRRAWRSWLAVALVALALGALSSLNGCFGGGSSNPPPQTYTVNVTGSSGAIEHSATITLTVE